MTTSNEIGVGQSLYDSVRWLDSGIMQVSNSKHTGWYDMGHDASGQLTCSCKDFAYRGGPRGYCKHTMSAAEHLATHAPSTEGQRRFAHETFRDRTREILRIADEYEEDPEMDDYGPGPGAPADAGGAQAPEEPEGPATTATARLESLYD